MRCGECGVLWVWGNTINWGKAKVNIVNIVPYLSYDCTNDVDIQLQYISNNKLH